MSRLSTVLLLSSTLFCASPLFAADVKVEVLQDKLQHPWSVAFLPDNKTLLITERSGQLRSWSPEEGLSQPIAGVPAVWAERPAGCRAGARFRHQSSCLAQLYQSEQRRQSGRSGGRGHAEPG